METTYFETFVQANNYLIQGHLNEAISIYSELLSKNQNFDITINLCIARIKACDFEQAITDAENAIKQDSSRYEGYLYKGIANFSIGKLEYALIDFNEAKNHKVPEKVVEVWLSKCNLELQRENGAKPKQDQSTVYKQQTSNEESSNNQKSNDKTDEHFDIVREKIFSSAGKLSYTWYQTDNHIGLEFDQLIESKDLIKHNFEEKFVDISFPIPGNKNPYRLELFLWDEILPETAKIILNLSKVEIKLEKKNKRKNWLRLENEEKSQKKLVQDIEKAPAYPTSSKYKKDWSKIDRELDEELNKEKDEDALNSLFKEIYKNADENTRRAMIKSFQTSGGTVL